MADPGSEPATVPGAGVGVPTPAGPFAPASAAAPPTLAWREGSDRAWAAADATFTLRLPDRPRSSAALRRALARAAPLPPAALAWTDPEPLPGGGAVVTIARRAWLVDALAAAEDAAGHPLAPWARADGKPFRYGADGRGTGRDRWLTIAWACAGLAIGTAGLWASMRPAPAPDPALLTTVSPDMRDGWRVLGIAAPAFGPALAGLPWAPPAGATLAGVAADADGLTVSYAAADPDRLRAAMQGDPARAGLALIGQSRQPDGRYRVDFAVPGAPAPASSSPPAIVTAMAASGPDAAYAGAAARLRTLARAGTLALTIAPPGAAPGPAAIAGAPVGLRFAVAGRADAVLGFGRTLESAGPPMRLRTWQLRPDPAGARLDAELVVPWRAAR